MHKLLVMDNDRKILNVEDGHICSTENKYEQFTCHRTEDERKHERGHKLIDYDHLEVDNGHHCARAQVDCATLRICANKSADVVHKYKSSMNVHTTENAEIEESTFSPPLNVCHSIKSKLDNDSQSRVRKISICHGLSMPPTSDNDTESSLDLSKSSEELSKVSDDGCSVVESCSSSLRPSKTERRSSVGTNSLTKLEKECHYTMLKLADTMTSHSSECQANASTDIKERTGGNSMHISSPSGVFGVPQSNTSVCGSESPQVGSNRKQLLFSDKHSLPSYKECERTLYNTPIINVSSPESMSSDSKDISDDNRSLGSPDLSDLRSRNKGTGHCKGCWDSYSLSKAKKFLQSRTLSATVPSRLTIRKGSECAIELMPEMVDTSDSCDEVASRRSSASSVCSSIDLLDSMGTTVEESKYESHDHKEHLTMKTAVIPFSDDSELHVQVVQSPTKVVRDKTSKRGPPIKMAFKRRGSEKCLLDRSGTFLKLTSSQGQSGSEFEEDDGDDLDEVNKIRVGICAMNKKTYSRPMKEILSRLRKVFLLDFEVFPDEVILHEPVEHWPIVDCLISFYSKGFPLDKALKYVELRKPFLLNDLEFQYTLMDRRKVYQLLTEAGLEVPRYAVLNRNENNQPVDGEEDIIEYDDVIEVNGQTFTKPFVEKPVSAEDHNIYIYYPSAAGGGCQILFRKIGSRSSVYSSESRVRRTGSYVYEEFMATDGTDVKVYTVGEEYAHAEARKSPALDGKVERDAQGKEVRYPIILSAQEKLIAKKVCSTFKQTVCGFDLLRANGKALVCDVNGFSFVKTSRKYYDDCSQILADIIFQKLAPQLWIPSPLDFTGPVDVSEETPVHTTAGTMLELRCVIAIIRHGDRTPKQKMKMIVQHEKFFDLFEKYGGFEEGRLKLKKPKQLQEILDITRSLLNAIRTGELGPIKESPAKLLQLKSVLEMYGHFSGINRKVQIKSLADKRNQDIWSKFKGRNKSSEATFGDPNKPSLLLIVKWGGELTPLGKKQAEELGKAFRCMYPGEYGRFPGCGFLRLHSTYRHDLKIYASDEGRVQMTAAAFAKGLLALEGELTPILVHLVKSDKYVTGMLDTSPDVAHSMQRVKSRLHEIMYSDQDFTEEDKEKLAPTKAGSLVRAMEAVKNPQKKCHEVFHLVHSLTEQIKQLSEEDGVDPNAPILYHDESLRLMEHRWCKLEKDFKQMTDGFDISLIPDIYDCVKYDYLHNRSLGLKGLPELYQLSKSLADIVIPQEYGITKDEKLSISKQICTRLMKKIKADLKHTVDESETVHRLDPRYSRDVETPHRHVRTRLYFTSESHVHSILSVLRYGGLLDEMTDEQWRRALERVSDVSELSYLTQLVLMQYEDPMQDPASEQRYHVELYFSPGLKTPNEIIKTEGAETKRAPSRRRHLSREERFLSPNDATQKPRTLSGSESLEVDPQGKPVSILQASNKPIKASPPKSAHHSSSGNLKPRFAIRSIPQAYGSTNTSMIVGRSLSHPVISAPPDSMRTWQSTDSIAAMPTVDVIETLPALHPLINLHSSIGMKSIDNFLDDTTSEFSDSDNELSSPPSKTGRMKTRKKEDKKRSNFVSQISLC